MNDTQKIEEGAIVGAKADFESLNDWLEKIKKKIDSFEIKNPGTIYSSLAFFSLGYFFGLKNKSKVKWLLEGISGAIFGYSAINFIAEVNRAKDKDKDNKPEEKLKNVHIVHEDTKQD